MTDEVTGPHSKMEAEGAWNNDNPDDKVSRNVPSWYDLDEYVIRRVNSKVVGIAGFADKGDYAILGGMKSKEGSKSWRPMADKRLELIGNKPKIAGFKAKKIPNETWKEKNREVYDFDIPPEEDMGIDEKLVDSFRERYGEDFGIKKWWQLIKRQKPMSDFKWKQLIVGVRDDRFPSDREKYVKYSSLSETNRKMVNGYLKKGIRNPEKRNQYLQGIADEMARSSNDRYELEDRR